MRKIEARPVVRCTTGLASNPLFRLFNIQPVEAKEKVLN